MPVVIATRGKVPGAVAVALAGFVFSMLIAGAGAGFASPGLVTLVQERVDSLASTRAQAVVNSGTGFGVVIAGPLALILANQWRTAWWIIAAINAAATIAVLLTGKLPRTKTVTAERRAFRLTELKPLRLASVAALLAGLSSAAVWAFGRSLVTMEGHMSESEATTFWVCQGTAGIAGAFSGDLVTNWGGRRLDHHRGIDGSGHPAHWRYPPTSYPSTPAALSSALATSLSAVSSSPGPQMRFLNVQQREPPLCLLHSHSARPPERS